MSYTITDHQGSLAAYSSSGTWTRLSYDAWGRRRNAEDGSYGNVPAQATDRGYTGHEHMTAFGLINMNGRCYDPMMSSFLSVDACLQDPTSAQGFNRYAYCAYNPLRYTDPTGWEMGSGNGNLPDDYPPFDGYILPEVPIIADGIDTGGGGNDTPQGNNNTPGNYPYTPTIPSAPDGHSGTPASQSGPYYQPAPNPGNGSSGGHGTGGNIGGGKNNSKSAIQHIISKTLYPISVIGTAVSYAKEAVKTNVDKVGDFLRSHDFAPKNLSRTKIGNNMVSKLGSAGDVLGFAGTLLTGYDIYNSGDISFGDIYNFGLSATCFALGFLASTPVGLIVGAVAITADIVSCQWTGKTISEHIDNNIKWRYKL